MWQTEEIEKILPEEDARWWIAATGMRTLGNLPSEVDPTRIFFRRNSLSLPKPLAAVASKLSVPPEEFEARFETSRQTLIKARNRKLGPVVEDSAPSAAACFRMVSAYAAAYAATGEVAWRDKASQLLEKSKREFFADGKLHAFGRAEGSAQSGARAFLYALAVVAALDVADVTSDEGPLDWAREVCGIAGELFVSEHGLREASPAMSFVDLPIVDRQRIFDDTSGGLFALAEARLSASAHPARQAVTKLAAPLPVAAVRSPILFTDKILAALVKTRGKKVIRGKGLSPELAKAVERLPFQLVPRGVAEDSDGIPDGSVRVVSPDGAVKLISNPEELRKEFLLSDKTP